MAGKVAGQITINLNAGTAQFVQQMNTAGASVKNFGQQTNAVRGHLGGLTGSTVAAGASIRALEGNFNRNVRAVEVFLGSVLKLGPILQQAFPLVGGIAFASMLVELGTKAYEFYRSIQDGPEKARGAFRALLEPLKQTNDELRVSNDRLGNEIAKLEGKRQNTLKLALDEARTAADKLAQSLEKDLQSLDKLLREQNVGYLRQALGEAGTKDVQRELGGQTGFGGFTGRVAQINEQGQGEIDRAKTPDESNAARTRLNIRLQQEYNAEIKKFDGLIAQAQATQAARSKRDAGLTFDSLASHGASSEAYAGPDQSVRLEQLIASRQALREGRDFTGLNSENTSLTQRRDADQAKNANSALDRPFQDRIKALNEELASAKAKTMAAGWSESAKVVEEAYGKTLHVIMEVNKALERKHTKLSPAQEGELGRKEQDIAAAQSEGEWQKKLAQTTAQIKDQTRSQELLTAAIGKGYEAIKRANVETRVMQSVGGEKYNDSQWMNDHAGDVQKIRSAAGGEYDAHSNDRSTEVVSELKNRIDLEKALATVQMQGAEAVRLVTLAYRLRELTAKGATQAQIRAEIDLYNATRKNAEAGDIAKIDERRQAIEKLTAAQRQGAEAVRKQELENKYAEQSRNGATPAQISTERQSDEAAHQQEITKTVSEKVNVYSDALEKIRQEENELRTNLGLYQDQAQVLRVLKDLEDQRLKTMVQETLAQRDALSGVKAFFLEMQEQAQSAAQSIYDALNSAFNKVSDNLTRALTGQKTAWAQAFKDIGRQLVESQVKSALQQGLGALGKKFGIDLGGKSKPDGTASNPIWVKLAGATRQQQSSQKEPSFTSGDPGYVKVLNQQQSPGQSSDSTGNTSIPGGGGLFGSGALGGGIFSLLGGLGGLGGSAAGATGAGADGLTEAVSSTISFGGGLATGGPVDPSKGYIVGERGPEPFFPGVSGSIMSHASMERAFGGNGGGPQIGSIHVAAGVDANQVYMSVHRAIAESERRTTAHSVRAVHDSGRRSPRG